MKFKYEIPSLARKQDAIDYINEFYQYNSKIHGVGGLDRYLADYEAWLLKLEEDCTREVTEERVPGRTYFFVRVEDNKIIGMVNIRTKLNQKMIDTHGHIGYSIRPTERGNGYNKINLYLALKVCREYEIKEALLDADSDNPASWRTMESLGGKLYREEDAIKYYSIDVEKSLETYCEEYEPFVK